MKTTNKLKKSDLTITVVLLIGILAIVNFFSAKIFIRWDLTEGNIYSISSVSKKTVGQLEDIVNIKAYFSNLPSQFLSVRQEVSDVLDEYQALSGGKLKIEYIDPSGDEKLQQELYMLGIPQLTFQVYEKDKVETVNGYFGMAISFGDKVEVIPAIKQNTSDLEYQLTTAIKKVTADDIATIGFLKDHNTISLDAISVAKGELEDLYVIEEIELGGDDPQIPEDIDTLIILGPKDIFAEAELKALDKFIVRGGALVLLNEGVEVGEGLVASEKNTGLDSLLSAYGINLNKDLVADQVSGMASFTQGFFSFSTNYPLWPKITSQQGGFNTENSAVANLENVVFPWASSIDLDPEKIKGNTASEVLLTTTGKAWRQQDNFNLNPQGLPAPAEQKQFNLGVVVRGGFTSAYGNSGSAGKEGNIIVVGDSDFLTDAIVFDSRGSVLYPDNLTLFLNLVDSVSLDDDLIKIRSKEISSRPLEELSESTKAGIRYVNVLGLTLIVIAFGLIRYYLRRRSRFVDDL